MQQCLTHGTYPFGYDRFGGHSCTSDGAPDGLDLP